MKLDDVARLMKGYGFPWTAGRVSDLEAGRKAVSIPELVALLMCLSRPDDRLALKDLFKGDAPLELSRSWDITTEHFLELLDGGTISNSVKDFPVMQARHEEDSKLLAEALEWGARANSAWNRYGGDGDKKAFYAAFEFIGTADRKAAKALNLSVEELTAASFGLWGKQFTEQRDHLAVDESAQAKGHVSRQMMAELREYVEARRGVD